MTRNGQKPDRRTTDDPLSAIGVRTREALVAFARNLREAGAEVPVNASLTAAETLAEVGFRDRERVRDALRTALLTRPDDRELFDHLFDQFWEAVQATVDAQMQDDSPEDGVKLPTFERPTDGTSQATEQDVADAVARRRKTDDVAGVQRDDEATRATFSPVGRSEPVEPGVGGFDTTRMETATRRLSKSFEELPGRRDSPANVGRRIDIRTALRESVATGGIITSLPRRQRDMAAARAVVFADVSRSVLDVIDRDFLITFLHTLHKDLRTARMFLFDTDVQEITGALDAASTVDAYEALEDAETQWGGGTRIGHALTTVRSRHPHAIDRRTVVLIISDGLEMGDLSNLEDGMSWLARRSLSIFWFNPLADSEEFEPTVNGMATAAPYVDGIFPFTGPADLEEMARQIEV